jgi:hypothetical protein
MRGYSAYHKHWHLGPVSHSASHQEGDDSVALLGPLHSFFLPSGSILSTYKQAVIHPPRRREKILWT